MAGYHENDVYLIKTDNRTSGINRLLEKFNLEQFSGKKVAIKANYNSADNFPASTHIQTLESLVSNLQEAGASEMVLAERSGMGVTRKVLENRGVFDLSEKLGFEVVILDEEEREMDQDQWR